MGTPLEVIIRNTTWPGYTTFSYRFSNMHGPRQPSWEHYREFMDWTARVQWVAQSGVPKMNLAFWLKRAEWPSEGDYEIASVYEQEDLVEAGYSYEYLSPEDFMLPEAYVEDNILAPDRQAFKAMIVRANDSLTIPGVERLADFANAGLPIVFSGGIPQNLLGYNESRSLYVEQVLAGVVGMDNVHIVPYDNLAVSLENLGIMPRTKVSADRLLYTYWREDANAFVYNDAWHSEMGEGAVTGSITFDTTGAPYSYDAWTGEIAPTLVYQDRQAGITIPMMLAGNQSAIIAFHHNETAPSGSHLLSAPPEIYSVTRASAGNSSAGMITLKYGNSTSSVLQSNGASLSLRIPPAPYNLTSWNLTIESWTQPDDPTSDQTTSKMSNSTYELQDLKPCNQISEPLRNVSGRGFYTTAFTWPPTNTTGASTGASGGIIDLDVIVNTARVWVNGKQLPPLDPTAARADIGDCLMEGMNEEFRDVVGGLEPTEQEYGLVYPVVVVPYVTTTIQL